jgi:hypothetical protein
MAGATHAANRFEVFPLLSAIVGGREALTRQVQKDVALFALLGMTIELLRYIPDRRRDAKQVCESAR